MTEQWKQQPGGLHLAVARYDQSNPEHRAAAEAMMRNVVQTVAKTHGAAFSEKHFRQNMQALAKGDLILDLYMAKWDVCQPKAVYVGAALNWAAVGIDPQGRIVRAVHTEDTCLLTGSLRELIRTKPDGKAFPDESLAQSFERIGLQTLARDGTFYRFGEVDRDNTKMLRALNGNGAAMGTAQGSAVLEFQRLPNDLSDRFPLDVKVIALKQNAVVDPNNFIVRWHDGNHDIRFIVTKGRATAMGQPRADIRTWHNGALPEPAILNNAVSSLLLAIKQEVEDRSWGDQPMTTNAPSPSIPLLGTRPEIYTALYGACGTEIVTNADGRPSGLGNPMPDAHVYVLNDQRMLSALTTIGAQPRLFGNKPMVPGVNILMR